MRSTGPGPALGPAALDGVSGCARTARGSDQRRVNAPDHIDLLAGGGSPNAPLAWPARVGLGLTVFVTVRTNQHNERWLEDFARGVQAIPEVLEFYRMSGDIDYLLKIVARDVADYDRIYKRLIRVAELHDVSSSFAMERIKHTTVVPVE